MWGSSACFDAHISRCGVHQRILAVTFQDVRFISAFLWPHFEMWQIWAFVIDAKYNLYRKENNMLHGAKHIILNNLNFAFVIYSYLDITLID